MLPIMSSKRTWLFLLALLVPGPKSIPGQHRDIPRNHSQAQELSSHLASIPSHLIENRGQEDPAVKYSLRLSSGSVFFTIRDIVFRFRVDRPSPEDRRFTSLVAAEKRRESPVAQETADVRLEFIGAEEAVEIQAYEQEVTSINYLRGAAPERWIQNIPVYRKLRYQGLYPGIDLEIDTDQGRIKQEYHIQAGGRPEAIRLRYSGASDVRVNAAGQLEIAVASGVMIEERPVSYQVIDGKKRQVATRYHVSKDKVVSFILNEYRRDRDLVIDPLLVYSTFLGGSDEDAGYKIALDRYGNAYVTGRTRSSGYPTTPGAYDQSFGGGVHDVFVSKLNAAGTTLLYSTFIGGEGDDVGYGIAVDDAGSAYVVGSAGAIFPTTPGAYDISHNGGLDAFVAVLDPSGASLTYSTYLGGSGDDFGYGLVLDAGGNIFLTGKTASADFPTSPGAYDTSYNGGIHDVFITKMNPAGTDLVFSTFLGGNDFDFADDGIAVDDWGNTYITGWTVSPDFPLSPGAFDTEFAGYSEAFVTKLNAAGSDIEYSTYLGGGGADYAQAIAVDALGHAYVTGHSFGVFPTTPGAFDETPNGDSDAIVTKLNLTGTGLAFSTYLGGGHKDRGYGIALDDNGTVYLTGRTDSGDFPTTPDAFDASYNGTKDVFVAKIDSTGRNLLYSTYFGGSSDDAAWKRGIAVDGSGMAYITGKTASADFPVSPGAVDTTPNGSLDVFISKLYIPPQLFVFQSHDYTRSGDSDISVWRPAVGKWFIQGLEDYNWGAVADIPVPGDYNGDGFTDIAVWRPTKGRWYIRDQSWPFWGQAGDTPVPGDYDGDGITDVAVWKPASGRWSIQNQGNIFFGQKGDIPLPADYDGDGNCDVAVWRPVNGTWYVLGKASQVWGAVGDLPVPGDYDGDGDADIAVWRPSNGRWYIMGQAWPFWGHMGDIPVPGDYDGDGTTDIAVWRPVSGRWYIRGQNDIFWGRSGDIPLIR